MIGVKLADRKFFPVFDIEKPGKKRMVLTTVFDDQYRAQITLVRYRGDDAERDQNEFTSMDELGVIELQDLPARKQGEPDLDLILTLDKQGNLDAVATDRLTGNMQSLSVSVYDDVPGDPFRVPASLSDRTLFDERDEEASEDRRRPLVPFLIAALLLLFFGLGFLGYRYLLQPAADSVADVPATQAETEPDDVSTARSDGTPAEPTDDIGEISDGSASADADSRDAADTPTAEGQMTQPDHRVEGVESYKILWGDTLWDISERFYGTPWLFPELADRNQIQNPDLIYASSDIVIPRR